MFGINFWSSSLEFYLFMQDLKGTLTTRFIIYIRNQELDKKCNDFKILLENRKQKTHLKLNDNLLKTRQKHSWNTKKNNSFTRVIIEQKNNLDLFTKKQMSEIISSV